MDPKNCSDCFLLSLVAWNISWGITTQQRKDQESWQEKTKMKSSQLGEQPSCQAHGNITQTLTLCSDQELIFRHLVRFYTWTHVRDMLIWLFCLDSSIFLLASKVPAWGSRTEGSAVWLSRDQVRGTRTKLSRWQRCVICYFVPLFGANENSNLKLILRNNQIALIPLTFVI